MGTKIERLEEARRKPPYLEHPSLSRSTTRVSRHLRACWLSWWLMIEGKERVAVSVWRVNEMLQWMRVCAPASWRWLAAQMMLMSDVC